jgi:putative NADPH-quinone reductase
MRHAMKILILLAHPDTGSFNHAIANAAREEVLSNGHEPMLRDLYGEHFDPTMTSAEFSRDASLPDVIEEHCRQLSSADGIIIVHPNWWGQPPAILKGWVDRVVRPGVAYEFVEGDTGEGVPNGLLKGKSVIVFNTSNTPATREQEVFGDPLELLWKNCIFDLCGVTHFHRRTFSVIVTSTKDQRAKWLGEVRNVVRNFFAAAGSNANPPSTSAVRRQQGDGP